MKAEEDQEEFHFGSERIEASTCHCLQKTWEDGLLIHLEQVKSNNYSLTSKQLGNKRNTVQAIIVIDLLRFLRNPYTHCTRPFTKFRLFESNYE